MSNEDLEVVTFPSGAGLPVVAGPVADHEEHWDPKSTGNPLLDAADIATRLSPSFTVGELTRSGGRRFQIARIDPEFVGCLQSLRDFVGKAVVVDSGYRSWGYNEAIYERRGKPPTLSRHCCGQAADVRVAGMDGMQIAKATIDAYGKNIGVGIGRNYAHIDVRGSWARWSYLVGDEKKRAIREIDAYRRARRRTRQAPPSEALGTSPGELDVGRAVRRNRHHANRLSWAPHRADITKLVGISAAEPSEEEFAEAVAVWQRSQGLVADGIVGPITWKRIQQATGGTVGGSS